MGHPAEPDELLDAASDELWTVVGDVAGRGLRKQLAGPLRARGTRRLDIKGYEFAALEGNEVAQEAKREESLGCAIEDNGIVPNARKNDVTPLHTVSALSINPQ